MVSAYREISLWASYILCFCFSSQNVTWTIYIFHLNTKILLKRINIKTSKWPNPEFFYFHPKLIKVFLILLTSLWDCWVILASRCLTIFTSWRRGLDWVEFFWIPRRISRCYVVIRHLFTPTFWTRRTRIRLFDADVDFVWICWDFHGMSVRFGVAVNDLLVGVVRGRVTKNS